MLLFALCVRVCETKLLYFIPLTFSPSFCVGMSSLSLVIQRRQAWPPLVPLQLALYSAMRQQDGYCEEVR